MTRRLQTLALILVLALAYFCSGKFGLSLAFVNLSATAVWPPTGIALAALLLGGYRLWPGVFLGAFLANITTQGSFATTLGIATGNTLEAVTGAWLVSRFARGPKAFEQTGTIVKFVFLSAVLSTTVSATLGVTTLCAGHYAAWGDFSAIWLTWWLGDAVSDMIVAPLLLIWATQNLPRLRPKRILEAAGTLFVTVLIGQIIFLEKGPFGGRHLPMAFFAIPPLLWGAFRFGERGAITLTFVLSCIAFWGTLHGSGPFALLGPHESLLLLQLFVGTASIKCLVVASVVSERRRAEEALREAQTKLRAYADDLERVVAERTSRLRESIAELEAFCYSLSHDMRAPLRAIQSFSQIILLEHSERLGPPGTDFLKKVVSSAERLDRLIQEVLAISGSSSEEIRLERVDVERLVREIMEERSELQPPRAEIRIETPLLPMRGHEASLMQCITNFLDNAVKFVGNGTRPRVTVRSERVGGQARLWFEDNGIGIEKSAQKHLFGIFQRLHPEQNYPGTGIGLAIVQKAAQRMNGQVGVESEPGKGSRFWLQLPIAN